MEKMEILRPKGTRDFLPEEKIVRDRVVNILKEVFELYGFSPLETPMFERYDVLASKYAGGAEILKETFRFKDQGGRELGLRYDLTVPLARLIGMNPQLKMPFKRYEIGEVFRDGPIKTGRLRSFMQCDVDVIGNNSVRADAEILNLVKDVFRKLKIDVVVRLNNRKILNQITEYAGVDKDKADATIIIIDKLEKFGVEQVKKELNELGISGESISKILKLISVKGGNEKKIKWLRKILGDSEGLREVGEILSYAKYVVFDASLARGLSYYTGPIFEVFAKNSEIKNSIAAGGRWDNMIGKFLERGNYPATGISFGLDVITEVLKLKAADKVKTVAKAYVIPIKKVKEAFAVASKLRGAGIKTDIDLNDRGLSKNLEYVNKLGIPYAVIIGDEEVKKKKVRLRDMRTGKERLLTTAQLIKDFK